MITIDALKVGVYQTNCYIVSKNGKALVIDPGSKATKIIEHISDMKVIAILLTHGHLDHIKAVDELVKTYNCPVYCHQDDILMLSDPKLNCSYKDNVTVNSKVTPLHEGKLKLDGFAIDIYHTPGHTMGSVIYAIDDSLFTGDTLFKLSVGRTDLATGNANMLKDSLNMIKQLDSKLYVYPGHDETTTLAFEIAHNPFLR